ncbi:nitroreductase family protein [Hamadaea sp. NPDC051192]|uniref:nitroreductase family protein n=1 Tax=Hamadaea sp. NPDC051192 TaxID=3154940 RepID=UPI0034290805
MNDTTQSASNLLGDPATALLRSAGRRSLARDAGRLRPMVGASALRLSSAEVDALNRTRRSVRDYSDEPLPRDAVSDICRAGAEACDLLEVDDVAGPRWLVFARAVSHTHPGVYEFRDGQLVAVAAQLSVETMMWAGMEPLTTAPCIVTPLWDLGEQLAGHGTDGYLNLLLRTGYSLHQALVVATRLGVGACLFRGIHADALSAAVGGGRLDSRGFLALSLGLPPGASGR